jgi:hypothetical protein
MKQLLLLFLLPIFLSSCFTAGITTLSNKKYIPLKNWNDTVVFIKAFDQFKQENKNLCLDSIVVRKVVESFINSKIKDSSIYNPTTWYRKINTDFKNNVNPDLYSWYLITEDKNTIFELALFYGGISIWHVRKYENGKYIVYTGFDESRKKRKVKKQAEHIFETEILPVLKPYFKDYMK